MKHCVFALFLLLLSAVTCAAEQAAESARWSWPAATQTSKPWTRWWWHGSAVDDQNISRLLKEYQSVGLGGVEITCIYGVKGQSDRQLPYRSDAWVHAVQHTLQEAQHLGLGVDLPAGSGWRMGGPNVPQELANSELRLSHQSVQGPAEVSLKFDRRDTIQAVIATQQTGEQIDLTKQVDVRELTWQAPAGNWRIDVAGYRWAGDRVKRPAPGGGGLNINPIWDKSVDAFLSDFGHTLDQLPGIRSQFHDSFEYEGNWSPDFFEEFSARRGYRLEQHLAELAGTGDPALVARIKADYRATLADLVREDFIGRWVNWSHQHGNLARNQSHGSPANWLDLYAMCDIPEIESFGRLSSGDANRLVLKFASSAANVTGKPLVSSETATWLDEHFHVQLGDIKQMVDRQFLAGVNHTFYHGTAYSPADAAWPGWVFYASTQLNPQNSIWHDFPALNAYVTRCQSVLQASQPDNDVLLYWPLHDTWHNADGMRDNLSVHSAKNWLLKQPVGSAAKLLDQQGYAFDYVSDRLLQQCQAHQDGKIRTPGGVYSAIVVPAAKHVPLETMQHLHKLALAGCPVLFWQSLPESLPGYQGYPDNAQGEAARTEFKGLVANLEQSPFQGKDLAALLHNAKVRREPWVQPGKLDTLRKKTADGTVYVLHNPSGQAVNQWITPACTAQSWLLASPSTGTIGTAKTVQDANGKAQVRVQLAAGELCLLLALAEPTATQKWVYQDPAEQTMNLDGPWQVEFLPGSPALHGEKVKLPESFTTTAGPQSWTEAPDTAATAFAGTAAYTYRFTAPPNAEPRQLNLGKVAGSARVSLNGGPVQTLLGPTYTAVLDRLQPGDNTLRVEVTGVAANRIRDLDRRGVAWRIFEDINVVNIRYRKFDATKWPVRPLGLLGPVTLSEMN